VESRRIVRGQPIRKEKLARAVELRKCMTGQERLLWSRLRANRLQGIHFRRQQVIDGFIVDFYCDRAGVVIEIDGPVHERSAEYDRDRDAALHARDLKVLRFTNQEIRSDLAGVLESIADSCRRVSSASVHPPRPAPGQDGAQGGGAGGGSVI